MIRLSQTPTAEQAAAITAAGPGAIVQHPRAGSRKGRAKVGRQLGALGVPTAVVSTIGWATSSGILLPVDQVTPEQRASAGLELAQPEVEADE